MNASRIVRLLLIACSACVLLGAALAQSVGRTAAVVNCSIFTVIDFADGRKLCLSDVPAASRLRPAGGRSSLVDIAAQRRIWSLWAPAQAACSGVYGFDWMSTTSASTASDLIIRTTQAVRTNARQMCETQRKDAGCQCVEVATTGSSPLTLERFSAAMGALAPGVDNASPPMATAAAVPTVNPSALIPSAAPAPPPAVTTAPQRPATVTDNETVQLRKELAALRQEIAEGARVRASSPAAPGRPRVRALVIGNGNYRFFGRLANPVNDAKAIAQKLAGFGIDVQTVLDADRDSFIRSLNTYAERSAPGDIGILFYAGHGVQVDGINYLVPVNMQADGVSAGYLKLAGISLNDVIGYMPPTTRLIFLDACRDNPATRGLVATRSTSVGVGLAPVTAATGTLISYATRDGAVAEDGNGSNSPYTSALLQHLDVPLDIALVLRQVRQSVMRMTGNRQQPWEYGSLVGEQLILSQVAR